MATDGRYFNQAGKQLDKNWELLKQGLQDVPTWEEWAATEAAGGRVVAVDPTLISSAAAKTLSTKITKGGGSELLALSENLVDIVWGKDRPARPSAPVTPLLTKYSGKDTKSKLAELREVLDKKKHRAFVVSMLDEIAWLFNLRGKDIPYNPVFFSYAIVTPDSATLYVDSSRFDNSCQSYCTDNSITIKPYDAIFTDTEALGTVAASEAKTTSGDSNGETNGDTKPQGEAKKFLISNKGSWALKLALGGDTLVEQSRSPVADAKSFKNETELEGMRQCHIRDGVALIQYFAWLEDQLLQKNATLDEVDAADKLESFRAQKELFVGLSFDTISSTGPK
jgi:Xaa-Pro aminopeptidase